MYIKKISDVNLGPIKNSTIEFPFDEKKPKPIILVGENGSGKSTFISTIVDSFYEIASMAFSDARKPAEIEGYQYYKTISPTEIYFREKYLYSYIVLEDSKDKIPKIEYVFKSGNVSIDDFKKKVKEVSQALTWKDKENYKKAVISKENAEDILVRDILCYFGPDRYEKPFWMGTRYYEISDYEHPTVKSKFSGKIGNPISVNNMTNITLQWLLDVIVDSRCDVSKKNDGFQIEHISAEELIEQSKTRKNIETIMSKILGVDVYFGLNFRGTRGSRFNIKVQKDNSVVVPTLDSLSTGQSALFNMFATIVRYADSNNMNNSINLSNITGIVIIDEIELHLHSILQHEILPELIALFPKVQFIITTHSSLFLLGMNKKYSENGFEIYQMPDATKISVERFSEFQKAYAYLSKTKKYEDEISTAISLRQDKMLVITEGATDWKHMKAAYNKLSKIPKYKDIFEGLDFDFLEYAPKNSKEDCETKLEMGDKNLCSLCENHAKINQSRKMVFIADRDVDSTNKKLGGIDCDFKKWGNKVYSFTLPLPNNRSETPNICIEHLYSDKVIKTEVQIEHSEFKRRLYIGNEFDKRGLSNKLKLNCERAKICGEKSIAIIEGSTGERVTSFEDSETNLALPKMEFANMILHEKKPFENVEFDNFIEIFRILKSISEDVDL